MEPEWNNYRSFKQTLYGNSEIPVLEFIRDLFRFLVKNTGMLITVNYKVSEDWERIGSVLCSFFMQFKQFDTSENIGDCVIFNNKNSHCYS